MAGLLEYFDKRNQRSVEFENERHRRRLKMPPTQDSVAALISVVVFRIAIAVTGGTVKLGLFGLATVVLLVLAVRAWVRYRREKRAWIADHPLEP